VSHLKYLNFPATHMLIQYVRKTVAHLTLDVGSIDSDHFNETVELVHMTIL